MNIFAHIWVLLLFLNVFGAGKAYMIFRPGCSQRLSWGLIFIALRCKVQVSRFSRIWVFLQSRIQTQKHFSLFLSTDIFFHPLNDNHYMFLCVRVFHGKTYNFFKNMLPFSLGPWIECFNMDWMRLELAKLGWSLAEVVDVYREVYCSLLCAVKCRCPGLAVYEYFCKHGYKLKNTFFYVYPRTIVFPPTKW